MYTQGYLGLNDVSSVYREGDLVLNILKGTEKKIWFLDVSSVYRLGGLVLNVSA